MKLKVCGITTLEQMQQLQRLDVDYAGLIFYEGSKRYAHEKLQASNAEIRNLEIKKVGVFVNADMGFVKSLISEYNLAAVQLHGDETVAYCEQLKNEVDVTKVFRIGAEVEAIDKLIEPYQQVSDYFLFDTDTTAYGGSGKRFDWTILENAAINKSFFLSGGIGPDDMGLIKSFRHPFLHAIDVNSRFEVQPGIKDMGLVQRFSNAFKQHSYG
jgi:phosphoribosylanthranilate isomerase